MLLVCATLVAYLPAIRGGLLWDDAGHVTKPELRTLNGLRRIWFELGSTQQYYPVVHTAFWVEHRLWGDATLGYHVGNILLHSLSACLLVLIMKRLQLPGAWLAGFVFALHPVCVESVAWISEQKNTLSTALYLAAALTYLRFDRTRQKRAYFFALGLFVLALLSKTVTATLPAALLVVFWWQRSRIRWIGDFLPLLPHFCLGALAGLLTAWVERTSIGAQGPAFALTFVQRCLVAGRALWFYFGKVLWPSDLTFFYPRWRVDANLWWQYLFPMAVVCVGLLAIVVRKRSRGPLATYLFYVCALFPSLGFVDVYPFFYSYVADHFQYLAAAGLIVSVCAWSTVAARRLPSGRKVVSALAVGLVCVLGGLTARQSRIYLDEETLYRETLVRNPNAWVAHNDLGLILARTPGRLGEAIDHFETALRIKPDDAEAHNNLGTALLGIPGRSSDAIAEYEAALRIKPGYAEVHYHLATVLASRPERFQDAISHFEAALRINPDRADIHTDLAGALSNIPGRLPEAISHLRTALRIRPNYAEAHYNLGNFLSEMGNVPGAIGEYEAAILIRPDYAEAHNNLGLALFDIGKLPDAIVQYEAALRIRPEYVNAHCNLAIALAQTPARLPEAIAHVRAALQVRPDLDDVRKLLDEMQSAQRRLQMRVAK